MNPSTITIYLATDHAGFAYKEMVKKYLLEHEYNVIDCGADRYEEGDDYPDYISRAAKEVSKEPRLSAGVIFGGSGEGEAIVANRFTNVRATVCYGGEKAKEIAAKSREHNDSNVLSIGARFVQEDELLDIVDVWLKTEFSQDERHQRRIKKIEQVSA